GRGPAEGILALCVPSPPVVDTTQRFERFGGLWALDAVLLGCECKGLVEFALGVLEIAGVHRCVTPIEQGPARRSRSIGSGFGSGGGEDLITGSRAGANCSDREDKPSEDVDSLGRGGGELG